MPDRFTTPIPPGREDEYRAWKQKYAPNDSGEDYDLPGAWLSGLKPGENGHWSDEFKKPNHPTFSVESRYAKFAPEKAGRWDGETYIPPKKHPVAIAGARTKPPAAVSETKAEQAPVKATDTRSPKMVYDEAYKHELLDFIEDMKAQGNTALYEKGVAKWRAISGEKTNDRSEAARVLSAARDPADLNPRYQADLGLPFSTGESISTQGTGPETPVARALSPVMKGMRSAAETVGEKGGAALSAVGDAAIAARDFVESDPLGEAALNFVGLGSRGGIGRGMQMFGETVAAPIRAAETWFGDEPRSISDFMPDGPALSERRMEEYKLERYFLDKADHLSALIDEIIRNPTTHPRRAGLPLYRQRLAEMMGRASSVRQGATMREIGEEALGDTALTMGAAPAARLGARVAGGVARKGVQLARLAGEAAPEMLYPAVRRLSPEIARAEFFRDAHIRTLIREGAAVGKTGEELSLPRMLKSLETHVGKDSYALGEGAYSKFRIAQLYGPQAQAQKYKQANRAARMKPLPERVRAHESAAVEAEESARARAIETGRASLEPSSAVGADMPRDLANTIGATEPTANAEFVAELEDLIDRPIRTGHLSGKKAGGRFKIKGRGMRGTVEVARTLRANDVPHATHEVAHGLELQFLEDAGFLPGGLADMTVDEARKALAAAEGRWGSKMGSRALAELRALDYEPQKARIQEGFAEWFRHYLTIGDHEVVAPHFSKYIDDVLFRYNPKWEKQVLKLRDMARQIKGQGAVNEVLSDIVTQAPPKGRELGDWVKWMGRRTVDMFVDDLAPIQRVEMEVAKGLLPGAKSPTKVARMVAQSAGARVHRWVFDGMTDFAGRLTGPSLEEVLLPVADKGDDFLAYSRARRALELHGRNIPDSVRVQAAAETVRKLGNARVGVVDDVLTVIPDESNIFEQAHRGWTKWNDGVMQYAVDSGVLSPEQAKIMRRLNQEYIPLKRVFAGQVRVGGGTGSKMGDLPQTFHKIKGSGRQIQHPLEAAMAQTEQIVSVSDKTRVAKTLVEMIEENKALGKYVERLPAQTIAQDVELSAIAKQLEALGADMSSADMDSILTVFSNRARSSPKENIVTFIQNGRREMFQIDPELYGAIQAVDQKYLGPIAEIFLAKPTRLIRLGATGIKPGFAWWTNPIRDFWTAIIQSGETGKTFNQMLADPFRAFARTTRGYSTALAGRKFTGEGAIAKEIRRLWATTGGELAQPLGLDKARLRRVSQGLVRDTRRIRGPYSGVKKAWRGFTDRTAQLLDATRDAMSVTESAPRLGEFEAVLRRMGWTPGNPNSLTADMVVEAANAAADVTLNFRRAGSVGRSLNQMYAFWNANMQGLSKSVRLFKDRPLYMMAKSFGVVTLPALANWWVNKDNPDWQRLSPREKMMYVYISTPLGPLKVPLPPGPIGIMFGGAPVLTLDSMYREDPQTFTDMYGEAFDQITPIPNPSKDFSMLMPNAVRPAAEAYFNRDTYRDRDLVPQGIREYRTPANQFTEYTPEVAKWVGSILKVSPMKVDHLLNGYSGGLWYDIGNMVDSGKDLLVGDDAHPVWGSKFPVFGRAFKHPYPSDFVNRLYREREHLKQLYGDWKADLGPRPSKRQRRRIDVAIEKVRRLREKRDEAKTREEARRLTNEMDRIAQHALGLR